MQYELHVVVAGTIAPSSTGTVSSFNGRTGAVTPASGDYTAATGVMPTSSLMAGKNFIINGGMDIWQRGTSFATNAGYTADRWQSIYSSANGTITQDSSVIPPNSKYGLRITATSGGISAYGLNLYQIVETFNTLPLAGKTVTVSFQAAGNLSGTPNLYANMSYSTSVDASLTGGTYTAITASSNISAVPSSSTFSAGSATFAIPSNAQTVVVSFQCNTAMTSGQYFTLGDVQLEIGSTATAFSRAGGTIQGELAACQRYYQQISSSASGGGSVYMVFGSGIAYSSTGAYSIFNEPSCYIKNVSKFYLFGLRTVSDTSLKRYCNCIERNSYFGIHKS